MTEGSNDASIWEASVMCGPLWSTVKNECMTPSPLASKAELGVARPRRARRTFQAGATVPAKAWGQEGVGVYQQGVPNSGKLRVLAGGGRDQRNRRSRMLTSNRRKGLILFHL